MNRRFLPLTIGSLLLALGCGGNDGPGGNEGAAGPSIATLVVTTTSLPNAAPTVAYTQTLMATGGDGSYTWSLTVGSLPTGLSLNASTGLILRHADGGKQHVHCTERERRRSDRHTGTDDHSQRDPCRDDDLVIE